MYLIYGSVALNYWFKDYNKTPKDLDIISNSEHTKELGTEYTRIPEFEYLSINEDANYVDIDLLYTIKLSHLSWDIKWDKHMHDIIFMKSKGCKIHLDFYKKLVKRWEVIHGNSKVRLNKQNKDFFSNNIKRRYNHDWLHTKVAFYKRPLHESIRKDLTSPLCSLELWNKLSYSDKLRCAVEELYTLVLERYIFVEKPLPLAFARTKMLKIMITSTTKGWFNLFLKENFLEIRELAPLNINNTINEINSMNSSRYFNK